MALHSEFSERTINELILMFKHRQINLAPGFQRNSVWTTNDRRRLIQSIISNYPVPSIFLYKRSHNGKLIYDVIDGKQRLETILMFAKQGEFKQEAFEVKLDLGDSLNWLDWSEIRRRYPHLRHAFESYKIQTVEVTGDLSEIIDLFIRINSMGKPLTPGEKRKAKFYESRFLKEAQQLVGKYKKYLTGQKILSEAQINRMKGTELFAELLLSIYQGGIINKKTALDKAIGGEGIKGISSNTLAQVSREFVSTLNTLKHMFPELRQTRFHNVADFYSLFMIVWEMRKQNLVLTDSKRNKAAERLLRRLSTGVDELREQLKKLKPAKTQQKLFSDYLLTVMGDTDSAANRLHRAKLLRGLLFSIFKRKDEQRTFSPEQRRILWNTDEKRLCNVCKKQLRWDDFTVDHVIAWTKGGATTVKNAQLMCRICNSHKGAQ